MNLKQKLAYILAGVIAFTSVFGSMSGVSTVSAEIQKKEATGTWINTDSVSPVNAESKGKPVEVVITFKYNDTADVGKKVNALIKQKKVVIDGKKVSFLAGVEANPERVVSGTGTYNVSFIPVGQYIDDKAVKAEIKITGNQKASSTSTTGNTSIQNKTTTKKKTAVKNKSAAKKKSAVKKKAATKKKTAIKKSTKRKNSSKKTNTKKKTSSKKKTNKK